jgi:hypothetical protein
MDEVMKIIYENNDKKNKKLPVLKEDIINYIKTYTGEIKIRNGVYMRQIPKNDERYSMLKKKPLIKQYRNSTTDNNKKGFAWWKVNDKFMMITIYNNKKKYDFTASDTFLYQYFYNGRFITSKII